MLWENSPLSSPKILSDPPLATRTHHLLMHPQYTTSLMGDLDLVYLPSRDAIRLDCHGQAHPIKTYAH